MKFLLLFLLIGLSFPAYADYKDWTKQNQRLYVSAMTLHTMDILQTFEMVRCQRMNPNCPYYEKNPFLGERPSKGKVVVVMGIAQLINFKLLNRENLSSQQRKKILIVMNSLAIIPIISNEQVGLGIYIPILPYKRFIRKFHYHGKPN